MIVERIAVSLFVTIDILAICLVTRLNATGFLILLNWSVDDQFLFFFFLMIRHPPRSPLFPYPPLSRSLRAVPAGGPGRLRRPRGAGPPGHGAGRRRRRLGPGQRAARGGGRGRAPAHAGGRGQDVVAARHAPALPVPRRAEAAAGAPGRAGRRGRAGAAARAAGAGAGRVRRAGAGPAGGGGGGGRRSLTEGA